MDVLFLLIAFSLGVVLPMPRQWWAILLLVLLGIVAPLVALIAMGRLAFLGG